MPRSCWRRMRPIWRIRRSATCSSNRRPSPSTTRSSARGGRARTRVASTWGMCWPGGRGSAMPSSSKPTASTSSAAAASTRAPAALTQHGAAVGRHGSGARSDREPSRAAAGSARRDGAGLVHDGRRGDTKTACARSIEKYHDPQVCARAFALASTHSEIELRHLGVTPGGRLALSAPGGPRDLCGSAPALARSRACAARARLLICGSTAFPATCRSCWSRSPMPAHVSLAQELVRAQEYLRARGFKFDLVVLNEIPTSYRQDVQDELQRMADASPSHAWLDRPGGLFLRRADLMAEERSRAAARCRARDLRRRARRPRRADAAAAPAVGAAAEDQNEAGRAGAERAGGAGSDALVFVNGFGGFTQDGREFHVSARPPAPWSNVIANERFGFVATDSGLGATWSENSYHNRLTPWSNDPIVDPPSEVVYLRDDKSGEFWTATPSPAAGAVKHVAKFGQGYATYTHRHRGLDVELTAFVPENDPIKILRLRIRNGASRRSRAERLLLRGLVLVGHPLALGGAHRHVDRHGLRRAVRAQCVPRRVRQARGVHGRRRAEPIDDRRSFELHRPQRHAVRSARDGVRPSARTRRPRARSMRRRADDGHRRAGRIDRGDVPARRRRRRGSGTRARRRVPRRRCRRGARSQAVMDLWNRRLVAVEVETPDAALDILTNRWLVLSDVELPLPCAFGVLSIRRRVRVPRSAAGCAGVSALRCRHRAQSHHSRRGPAVSRRRRAALVARAGRRRRPHAHPGRSALARLCGAGVRARDGRLGHLRCEGAAHRAARARARRAQRVRNTRAPHRARSPFTSTARARSRGRCETGAHGLPLMGTGDWNDGMDEVGAQGRGESVWLGWFLASLLGPFAALAESRGDASRPASIARMPRG